MADPTIFYLPRRRMAIAPYVADDTELLARRDVGIIDSAEGSMAREQDDYVATDLSGGACVEYVADSHTSASTGALTVNMMSGDAANLALVMSGNLTPVAAGTAAQETCATVADGDVIQLRNIPDPTTVVVSDSEGAPATLVEGTDYEWVAKNAGMIRFLSIDSYTQPFLVDYDMIDQQHIDPGSNLDAYYDIAFAGGNERNSCGGEFERFYRCRISEEQTRNLHEAAENKSPVAIPVTFTLDRDPARNYSIANFGVSGSA